MKNLFNLTSTVSFVSLYFIAAASAQAPPISLDSSAITASLYAKKISYHLARGTSEFARDELRSAITQSLVNLKDDFEKVSQLIMDSRGQPSKAEATQRAINNILPGKLSLSVDEVRELLTDPPTASLTVHEDGKAIVIDENSNPTRNLLFERTADALSREQANLENEKFRRSRDFKKLNGSLGAIQSGKDPLRLRPFLSKSAPSVIDPSKIKSGAGH